MRKLELRRIEPPYVARDGVLETVQIDATEEKRLLFFIFKSDSTDEKTIARIRLAINSQLALVAPNTRGLIFCLGREDSLEVYEEAASETT